MYTLQDCYKDFNTKKYKEVKLVKKEISDEEVKYYDENGNVYIEIGESK